MAARESRWFEVEPPTMLSTELQQSVVALRRDFHQYPEIAHQEHRTAQVVASRLQALGLDEVRTGVGQTGVVGILQGGRPGRTVLLRADMDALPLTEADRGQPYRSRNSSAHHACGHDGHTAILLTVAEILASQRAELPGRVSFVFQPAEERVGGAAGMIDDGALEPRPDACFGLHLWNELLVGTVDARPGPIYANADAFSISLGASGGHAALPHQTADPIAVAAYLITTLQTLVSRETPPLEPAVVTIGSIHGGTAPNIIPSRVELQGTLRTFDAQLREQHLGRLAELVEMVGRMFRVESTLTHLEACPACVNDPAMAELVRQVASQIVGADRVLSETRTGGAEDMSLFLNAAPGCYFFVGSANPERGLDGPHHSPAFDFDERALAIGVETLSAVALTYLRAHA
jgi:amidohydrolase